MGGKVARYPLGFVRCHFETHVQRAFAGALLTGFLGRSVVQWGSMSVMLVRRKKKGKIVKSLQFAIPATLTSERAQKENVQFGDAEYR